MFDPKHIVVPVVIEPDGALTRAEQAVAAACDVAKKFNAQLSILYIAPIVQAGDASTIDVTGQVYQIIEETIKTRTDHAQEQLRKLEKIASGRGILCSGRVIDSFDDNAQIIIDASHEIGADLIVVCSSTRHKLVQLFFGTLAEEIAHRSLMPVLVIQPEYLSQRGSP
jgi:nucleotide-binding universal stress UspA family protein